MIAEPLCTIHQIIIVIAHFSHFSQHRTTQIRTRTSIRPSDARLFLVQPSLQQDLLGEIGEDSVGSSAQHSVQGFQRSSLEVEDTLLGSRVDHGELSRDLVARDRNVLGDILRVAENIQEPSGRLDHDSVSALTEITADRTTSETTAGGRELITFPVAERRGRSSSITERAVKAARELRRIGNEHDLVTDIRLEEALLDSEDASVVHVRRSDTVGTGTGIVDGGGRNTLAALRLVECSVGVEHSTVAMAGVFAETHIAHDEHLGKRLLDGLDGENHGTVGSGGLRAGFVLRAVRKRDTEEDDGSKSALDKRGQERDELVDTATALAGKRGNESLFIGIVGDEYRVDESRLQS